MVAGARPQLGALPTTPWFRESIYQGILTAAGLKPANCVTHVEVKTLLASLQAPPAGSPPAAATAGTASVDAAFTKYMTLTQSGYSSSLSDIDALRALAQNPASGDAASRAKVLAKAQELKDWMGVLLGSTSTGGTASGTVPATLSLSLGAPRRVRRVHPGRRQDVHGGHDRERHLDGRRRDAERRRPVRHRDGPSGQRHVLAGGGAAGDGHEPARRGRRAGGRGRLERPDEPADVQRSGVQ